VRNLQFKSAKLKAGRRLQERKGKYQKFENNLISGMGHTKTQGNRLKNVRSLDAGGLQLNSS
jgi:hypothetical protein